MPPPPPPDDGQAQQAALDFSEHNHLLHEFWDLSEMAAQPAKALCIPKHPCASPAAHTLLPSGWAFCAALDPNEGIAREQLEALAAAMPAVSTATTAASGLTYNKDPPLRLVWYVPRRLWADFQARNLPPPLSQQQQGSGAALPGSSAAQGAATELLQGVEVQQNSET